MATNLSPSAYVNNPWNQINPLTPTTPATNELPPELVVEAEENVRSVNVRYQMAQLGVAIEQAQEGKIKANNKEVREMRNQLSTISDFLDNAHHAMLTTKGDKIEMQQHSKLIEQVVALLPEKTRLLLKDKSGSNTSTFNRKELEWVCQVCTREMDSSITPRINELQDDNHDIMELLTKLLPLLKEIIKKYDDSVSRMIQQAIPR
jgi:hypothetical protein